MNVVTKAVRRKEGKRIEVMKNANCDLKTKRRRRIRKLRR
jgi:putative ubiquitin-RnfH superfamily antitoxin RatB of RatAB toxin-antitoxin module